MTNIQLYTKLSALPNDLKKEVADFMDYLKFKLKKEKTPKKRVAGLAKGMLEMSPDFDEPLGDVKDYMQ